MSKTILAADDSASMRQIIHFSLSSAGFNVVVADDGRDALAKLQAQPVDMLITDLNMPNLDGISLIREVRALPNYKFLPIVMLTTESSSDLKQAGKTAGASGWITKPFVAEQLVAVVNRFLSR